MKLSQLCLGLLTLFVSLSGFARAADFNRRDSTYPSGDQNVTLEVDPTLVAVVLHDTEDELAAARSITATSNLLLPAEPRDQQPYTHLWLLRLATPLDQKTLTPLVTTLHRLGRVQFASPVYRFDQSLLVSQPEILIAFDRDDAEVIAAFDEEFRWPLIGTLPGMDTTFRYAVTDHMPHELFALTQRLASRPGVARVEPNFIHHLPTLNVPNDPRFGNQWSHQNTGQTGGTPGADMQSVGAWDTSTGSPTVVIAIIDEGVDMDHPDLMGNIVGGYDSTDQSANPPGGVAGNADSGDAHGTACAGIAAAVGNNGLGIAGVCWNAGILGVRMAYGTVWTTTAWEVDGITWASDNGADVLSNSWGGGASSAAVSDAIDYAQATGRGGLGCVILFATGNDNAGVGYPAKYASTIAVGASSPCDERKNPSSCDGETWGSNYGPEVDLVAPGVLIDTTDIAGAGGYSSGDYTATFNGTSSATPNAAGCAALLLSVLPGLTHTEARTYLQNACDDQVGPPAEDTPGFDNFMGHGRINLVTLMTLAGAPSTPAGLTCSESAGDVTIGWTNPQVYDNLIVSRDNVDLATLAGTATSYLDLAVAAGTHSYSVRGVVGGTSGLGATCILVIVAGATDLVWSPAAGIVDGGAGLTNALTANALSAVEVTSLTLVPDLDVFDRIWVNLGIYPNNIALGAADATLLQTYLTNGIGGNTLYMEGGDTWAFDAATTLHPLFEISGVADGTGDLATVLGLAGSACDLTGIDLSYGGENNWMDHLAPLASAQAIQDNSTPVYSTAIYNETVGYRTIGASFEFAGFVDGASTRADLMAAYIACLGSAALVPPVTALACSEVGDDVTLSWTNGGAYTAIEVRRNGGTIATLAAGSTSYVDLAPPAGAHTYGVHAFDGAASASTGCVVSVSPNPIAGLGCAANASNVDLVWTNGEAYDSIEILRNGLALATIAGSAVLYSDPTPPSGSHTYGVIGSFAGLTGAEVNCTVTFVAPPVVSSSPVDTAACVGAAASFSVIATGGGTLSYQWRLNSLAISGANTATLLLPGVTAGDTGSYDVVVSNSAGSATSTAAVLTLLATPTIVTQPTGATIGVGASAVFSIAATSSTPMTQQWYRDGLLLAGQTTTALTIPIATSADAGSYHAVIGNDCGTTTSTTAILTVLPLAPVIGVSCCATNDTVVVCWTPGASYDSVTVTRDSVTVATLPGTDLCFTDLTVAAGLHSYAVIGTLAGENSSANGCSTTVIQSPAALACVIQNPTFSPPDVVLSWSNPSAYDTVQVFRDDVLIATLGAATTHTDSTAVPGAHTYRVEGSIALAACSSLADGSLCTVTIASPPTFRRGDPNGDGGVNVADVVFVLNWVFGGLDPVCMDAADCNDDGMIDVADAVYLLGWVFTPGPPPPAPFDTIGPDPTDDTLGCGPIL